jgi:hypothetical protein
VRLEGSGQLKKSISLYRESNLLRSDNLFELVYSVYVCSRESRVLYNTAALVLIDNRQWANI